MKVPSIHPMSLRFVWDELATRFPPVPPQAELTRESPSDFKVIEEPAYPPSGSGEHVMVQVEKTSISTMEVVRRLADHAKADPRQVGFAGRKDVHSVAVQWFTVPRTKGPRLEGDIAPGIKVLRASLHKNKLQLGHLRSNTFEILLRKPVPGALELLQARLAGVALGVPNYFGPQRFGVDGANAEDGWRVLAGQRRGGDSRALQLLVSALQSLIFNHVASQRVAQDPDVLPQEGDIMLKIPTGAPFWCDQPSTDAPRVVRGEIAVSGPLPGSRMRQPRGQPLTLESRIMEQLLHDPSPLVSGRRAPQGDRRTILVRPRDLSAHAVPDGIQVRMALPPGSFATSVLREWAGITREGGGTFRPDES